MMKYTTLGRTGVKVSKLCLGTMNFGRATDEKESFKIMDAALDAGIMFFDTANEYGGDGHRGLSEEIIGNWFAARGNRRKVVLATKVYSFAEDPDDGPNEGHGLSTFKIRRHLENSLRRLKTDHLELYQMHHVDRDVTWDELYDVFVSLFNQGKFDYLGASNFAGWDLVIAQAKAKERNFLGLVCDQEKYNLLSRKPELELLPAAKHCGIGVITYSPLNYGILGGNKLKSDGNSRRDFLKTALPKYSRYWAEAVRLLESRMDEYIELCADIGASEACVALAWILSNPIITAPIIGPRTLEQLQAMLPAVDLQLSSDVLEKLDELFPGPGGAAPEAYAW
jgi:aryl-alcohol dehydrogenase-like predicted oxidoreductase